MYIIQNLGNEMSGFNFGYGEWYMKMGKSSFVVVIVLLPCLENMLFVMILSLI